MIDKFTKARQILQGLPKTDQTCKEIEQKNYMRVLSSFSTERDTYELMQVIIDKAYQIQQLQNEKRVAMSIIARAPENYKTVLTLFFLKGKTIAKIAEKIEKGESTTSRLISSAVEWFADEFYGRQRI